MGRVISLQDDDDLAAGYAELGLLDHRITVLTTTAAEIERELEAAISAREKVARRLRRGRNIALALAAAAALGVALLAAHDHRDFPRAPSRRLNHIVRIVDAPSSGEVGFVTLDRLGHRAIDSSLYVALAASDDLSDALSLPADPG